MGLFSRAPKASGPRVAYTVPVAIVVADRATGGRRTINDRVLVWTTSPSLAVKGAPDAARSRCSSLYGHLRFVSASVTDRSDVCVMDPTTGRRL